MTINVQWDNYQRTVLRIDYGSEWTTEVALQATEKARELINDLSHQLPVDVLLTVADNCVVASEAASHMRKCAHQRTYRTRHLVLVCDNPYLENLFKLVVTVDPVAADVYIHARTLDEARQIIASKGRTSRASVN